jgi:hypothetical protein
MIIINPDRRKIPLKRILKKLKKTSYGKYLGDLNAASRFLTESIMTSKAGKKEFFRYLCYLSRTPAHLLPFYRNKNILIFRFEEEMHKLDDFSFAFLMGWFREVFMGIKEKKKFEKIFLNIHKNIVK